MKKKSDRAGDSVSVGAQPDIEERALDDISLLLRDDMRASRLALEFAKTDRTLRELGVQSTVIVFGSARFPSPESSEQLLSGAANDAEPAIPARIAQQVRWYQLAREFGRLVSERGGALHPHNGQRNNVIVTGGGPGIMEAANRGAFEAGAPTIGLGINLPREQRINEFVTPELTFHFHYFAVRKMHFAMRARALAVFPGGFGTLDELFELLTLRQTAKAQAITIVLIDKAYWQRAIDFEFLVDAGTITQIELDLFHFADSAEEAWRILLDRGILIPTPQPRDV